jgi:uncharacterized protein YabN with tetrapyrrole methylase and pyrophosphatase domain
VGIGSLVVVGTGIKTVGHLTAEAIAWIQKADKVLYVVSDPIAEASIVRLNPAGAESLSGLYSEGKARIDTYNAMIDRILACVRSGLLTCAAFYGHPGVFVYPSHEAIRRARSERFSARMLPGISAEDCLFADLGIDPAVCGCQTYEATDFLIHSRRIDPSSSVILWQIGVVGDTTFKSNGYDLTALPLLVERMLQYYPAGHIVWVYEAAVFPGCDPVIRPVPLYALGQTALSAASTLYVPPAYPSLTDPMMTSQLNQAGFPHN